MASHLLSFLGIFIFLSWLPNLMAAPSYPTDDINENWLDKSVSDSFDTLEYTLRVRSFTSLTEVAQSSQNPENDFLNLADRSFETQILPNFSLNTESLTAHLKPRAKLTWQRSQGQKNGKSTKTIDEWYVNEWLLRVQSYEQLFISYGRENLQWGPSYLTSPSNPFFIDNGRRQTKTEVPGSDFFRAVWIPSDLWSFSLIANTDEGQQHYQNTFKDSYAFKFDYNSEQAYGSFIASSTRDDRTRIGGFVGWTASDALLLYGEIVGQNGSEARYPSKRSNRQLNEMYRSDNNNLEVISLAGGSYTFEIGPTLTLEYLYNSIGYDDNEADEYYQLREQAAANFRYPSPLSSLAGKQLGDTANTGLRFLRQNYFMTQLVDNDTLINDIDVTGRWLINIDDGSNQLYGSIEYSPGDNIEFFIASTYNIGSNSTEFGTYIDYRLTIGLEYYF